MNKIEALLKRKEQQLGTRVVCSSFDKHKNLHVMCHRESDNSYTIWTSKYDDKEELSYTDFLNRKYYTNPDLALREIEMRSGGMFSASHFKKITATRTRGSVDVFKANYKKEILDQLNGIHNEEEAYKNHYMQDLLASIGLTRNDQSNKEKQDSERSTPSTIEKEDIKEREERKVQMKQFEEKHSFELIYKLKKEVLQEVKQLDLSETQRQEILKIEMSLDQEKEAYDKSMSSNRKVEIDGKNDEQISLVNQMKRKKQKATRYSKFEMER